jgi:hypothetical protein
MIDPKPQLGSAACLATIAYCQSQQARHLQALEELSRLELDARHRLEEITRSS